MRDQLLNSFTVSGRVFLGVIAAGALAFGGLMWSGSQDPYAAPSDATLAEQDAHVRRCWSDMAGPADYASMHITLRVIADDNGDPLQSGIDESEYQRVLADPALRAFALRAQQIVVSTACNNSLLFRHMPKSGAYMRSLSVRFGT